MPKEPLYPHVPKSKEAQFPHRTSGESPKQTDNLPSVTGDPEYVRLNKQLDLQYDKVLDLFKKANKHEGKKPYSPLEARYSEGNPYKQAFEEAFKGWEYLRGQLIALAMKYQGKKYVVIKNTGATLSWESWVKELQGYQKRGEVSPEVEYPPLQCKYCGVPVPKEHLKGIQPEIWARYHIKGHRAAVKELAAKKLPWSAGLIPAVGGEPDLSASTINLLAKTEGDPLRKFCCRQCEECAAKELLEEGKFPDRIAWLRKHYSAKHPGMWGKAQAGA